MLSQHVARESRASNGKPAYSPVDHLRPGRPAHDAQGKARLRAEIENRHAQPRRTDDNPHRHVALLRMNDIQAFCRASDVPADGGLDHLAIAANHIAFVYRKTDAKIAAIVAWSRRFTPSIPPDLAKLLAARVVAKPCLPDADKLARRLGLTMEMRTALGITTIGGIGSSKALRAAERKRKRNEADRLRRAAKRTGRPRGRPSKGKPWLAAGISKATHYRREKRKLAQADAANRDGETKMRGQHSAATYAGLGISSHRLPQAPPLPQRSGLARVKLAPALPRLSQTSAVEIGGYRARAAPRCRLHDFRNAQADGGAAMTTIKEELQINAKHLRERAKRVEAAWTEARHIKLTAKRSAEAKASKRAQKRDAAQRQRHRDRQLGKLGAASAVRIIKPET